MGLFIQEHRASQAFGRMYPLAQGACEISGSPGETEKFTPINQPYLLYGTLGRSCQGLVMGIGLLSRNSWAAPQVHREPATDLPAPRPD